MHIIRARSPRAPNLPFAREVARLGTRISAMAAAANRMGKKKKLRNSPLIAQLQI
jgi:hypothetical protein